MLGRAGRDSQPAVGHITPLPSADRDELKKWYQDVKAGHIPCLRASLLPMISIPEAAQNPAPALHSCCSLCGHTPPCWIPLFPFFPLLEELRGYFPHVSLAASFFMYRIMAEKETILCSELAAARLGQFWAQNGLFLGHLSYLKLPPRCPFLLTSVQFYPQNWTVRSYLIPPPRSGEIQ